MLVVVEPFIARLAYGSADTYALRQLIASGLSGHRLKAKDLTFLLQTPNL
jgi:hypothetical protein